MSVRGLKENPRDNNGAVFLGNATLPTLNSTEANTVRKNTDTVDLS